jgi:flagellar biosynthetic protein FliR
VDLILFSIQSWLVFLVILARTAAIVGSLPVFTSSRVALRVRVGIAVSVALILFPVLDFSLPEYSRTPLGFGLIIFQESLLGLTLGFVTQLIFFAVQFGGTVVGYQMGFAAANILDPQSQQQVPLLSQFQNVFAILIFLTLNIHHIIFRVMVHSYEILPPGRLNYSGKAVPYLMEMAGEMFVLGLQLIAPIMVILMLTMFILGIMARVFPQLQVFMLSFPIKIALALILIGLSMETVVFLLDQEFTGLEERLIRMLHML